DADRRRWGGRGARSPDRLRVGPGSGARSALADRSAAQLALFESGQGALRSHLSVALEQQTRDDVPVHVAVEPDPDPSRRTDVGRREEDLGVLLHELGLLLEVRLAPERDAAVTVVVVHEHREGLLAAPPRRRAVREALRRLRPGLDDLAELRERV